MYTLGDGILPREGNAVLKIAVYVTEVAATLRIELSLKGSKRASNMLMLSIRTHQ